MAEWKKRWVDTIGDAIAQFEAWQEYWVALHPEDAPPRAVSDDSDEAVEEILQNWDKYFSDPDVIELFQTHKNVVNLDYEKALRAARERGL